MSWCYKYLTFLVLAIALLPLSAIAVSSTDVTTNAPTIQNHATLLKSGNPPTQVAPKSKIQNSSERPDFGKYFQQAGVKGTFLLYDLKQDCYLVYNSPRANTSFIPASTFKIFNSLVALETGVVKDENEVIKWDGIKRKIPEWNKDHTMRSAIAGSVVWFYQELARRIGQERMQRYINLANYGNRDISGGIDQFWLKGGLRISPKEQIDLLVRLYQNKLPFSQRTMATVKDILINEKTNDYVLRGKTGWGTDFTPQVGWYVGYLERGDRAYFFALNMDMNKPEYIKARMAITQSILRSMGLL